VRQIQTELRRAWAATVLGAAPHRTVDSVLVQFFTRFAVTNTQQRFRDTPLRAHPVGEYRGALSPAIDLPSLLERITL
jgi:hypothetical protein